MANVHRDSVILEFPAALCDLLARGGSELLEEIREGPQTSETQQPSLFVQRRTLLALDEDERRERLRAVGTSGMVAEADSAYLDALHEARLCLLADKPLRDGFLFSSDSTLWAKWTHVVDAVRLRSLCLQLEDKDSLAAELEHAAAVHEAESTLPGRYELTQAPLGTDTQVALLDTTADPADRRLVNFEVTPQQGGTPIMFKLSASAPKLFSLSEVLALRVPPATDAKLRDLLASHGCGRTASSLADVVRAHRRVTRAEADTFTCGAGGAIFSPGDLLTRFSMNPETLVRHMSKKFQKDHSYRVRLRSGLFVSLVSVNAFVVVARHSRQMTSLEYTSLAADDAFVNTPLIGQLEDAIASSKHRMQWAEAFEQESLVVMRGSRRSALQLVTLVSSSMCTSLPTIETLTCTPELDVHFVSFPEGGNTYAVVYGPRAEETIPHDAMALKQMQHDFAALQDKTDHLRESKFHSLTKRSREEQERNHVDELALRRSSAVHDPERVQSDLRATLRDILLTNPSSWQEIIRSRQLADFGPTGARPVANLEASLRNILSDNASHEKKKYYWKA